MATEQTTGITIGYTYSSGSSGFKTINELDYEEVTSTTAKSVATAYSKIVDGTMKSLKHNLTTVVAID